MLSVYIVIAITWFLYVFFTNQRVDAVPLLIRSALRGAIWPISMLGSLIVHWTNKKSYAY